MLLRVTGPDKIWPKTVEAQLQSGNAGDFWLLGGALLRTPRSRIDPGEPTHRIKAAAAERPTGEWNRYGITVDGEFVMLTVNGQVATRARGPRRGGEDRPAVGGRADRVRADPA